MILVYDGTQTGFEKQSRERQADILKVRIVPQVTGGLYNVELHDGAPSRSRAEGGLFAGLTPSGRAGNNDCPATWEKLEAPLCVQTPKTAASG